MGEREVQRVAGVREPEAIGDDVSARCRSVELRWNAASRIVVVHYGPETTLTAVDGTFLVDSLASWIGTGGEPFSVLAHAAGVRGTDAVYRKTASVFFREHREVASIALLDMGPVLSLVVEMFRIGTGIRLKAFTNEAEARAWLATKTR